MPVSNGFVKPAAALSIALLSACSQLPTQQGTRHAKVKWCDVSAGQERCEYVSQETLRHRMRVVAPQ